MSDILYECDDDDSVFKCTLWSFIACKSKLFRVLLKFGKCAVAASFSAADGKLETTEMQRSTTNVAKCKARLPNILKSHLSIL